MIEGLEIVQESLGQIVKINGFPVGTIRKGYEGQTANGLTTIAAVIGGLSLSKKPQQIYMKDCSMQELVLEWNNDEPRRAKSRKQTGDPLHNHTIGARHRTTQSRQAQGCGSIG